MGCDIHLYKEKKIDGVWVTADEGWSDEYDGGVADVPWEKRFTDRDYNLFGFLCSGVRRTHDFSFKERGIPFNICKEIKAYCDYYGVDGHSQSYLALNELREAWEFLGDKTITISGMKRESELQLLQASIDSSEPTDWNLLYPYCQGTSDRSQVDFSVEVDAVWALKGIQRIIKLFDGIEADDHRIVFWFDN